MITVFWDIYNVLIDYLKIEKIINRKYTALMDQLNDAIKHQTFLFGKEKSFSIMTMHPLTFLQLQSQNYMNCASNCC